jgi:hypothetical protein
VNPLHCRPILVDAPASKVLLWSSPSKKFQIPVVAPLPVFDLYIYITMATITNRKCGMRIGIHSI